MHYEVALDIQIEGAIDAWRTDRERQIKKMDHGDRALDFAAQTAAVVIRTSRELILPTGYEGQRTWDWVRSVTDNDLVVEDLQIALARELIPDTEQMAGRCIEITREVLFREPNPSVRKFMARLTRCYIAGFMPECVMLCRAVLENAVTEVVTALKLKPQPIGRQTAKRCPECGAPLKDEGQPGMGAKLDELLRVGRLTNETHEDAKLVWKRGNHAVHADPTVVQEVPETIDMTVRVLGDMYRQPLPPTTPSDAVD